MLGGLEWLLGGLKKGININLIFLISFYLDLCSVWNIFVGVFILCMVLIFLVFIRVKYVCSEYIYNELWFIVKWWLFLVDFYYWIIFYNNIEVKFL